MQITFNTGRCGRTILERDNMHNITNQNQATLN